MSSARWRAVHVHGAASWSRRAVQCRWCRRFVVLCSRCWWSRILNRRRRRSICADERSKSRPYIQLLLGDSCNSAYCTELGAAPYWPDWRTLSTGRHAAGHCFRLRRCCAPLTRIHAGVGTVLCSWHLSGGAVAAARVASPAHQQRNGSNANIQRRYAADHAKDNTAAAGFGFGNRTIDDRGVGGGRRPRRPSVGNSRVLGRCGRRRQRRPNVGAHKLRFSH